MFTLQSGSAVILTKHNILQAFLRFGDVGYLYYETGFTFGWVQFKSADAYAKTRWLQCSGAAAAAGPDVGQIQKIPESFIAGANRF